MLKHLRPAILMLAVMTVLTGLVYPLAVTGIAQLVFPYQANGSLIVQNGKVTGSALIGQEFVSRRYFHGRPSATRPRPYNAASSAASNLGPTSKVLIARVAAGVKSLEAENPRVKVPVDLVTSSASGLDPDITPAAALFQVPWVARARGLDPRRVRQLVETRIQGRFLGIFGERHVNVLELNLALDALK